MICKQRVSEANSENIQPQFFGEQSPCIEGSEWPYHDHDVTLVDVECLFDDD